MDILVVVSSLLRTRLFCTQHVQEASSYPAVFSHTERASFMDTQPVQSHRAPALSLMLCCHCLEPFNNFIFECDFVSGVQGDKDMCT